MSERRKYDARLVKIGDLLAEKRKKLDLNFKNREVFIYSRSNDLFGGEDWISSRFLASVELGKSWIGIEKLIKLSLALEENPVSLFTEIYEVYINNHE